MSGNESQLDLMTARDRAVRLLGYIVTRPNNTYLEEDLERFVDTILEAANCSRKSCGGADDT